MFTNTNTAHRNAGTGVREIDNAITKDVAVLCCLCGVKFCNGLLNEMVSECVDRGQVLKDTLYYAYRV